MSAPSSNTSAPSNASPPPHHSMICAKRVPALRAEVSDEYVQNSTPSWKSLLRPATSRAGRRA